MPCLHVCIQMKHQKILRLLSICVLTLERRSIIDRNQYGHLSPDYVYKTCCWSRYISLLLIVCANIALMQHIFWCIYYSMIHAIWSPQIYEHFCANCCFQFCSTHLARAWMLLHILHTFILIQIGDTMYIASPITLWNKTVFVLPAKKTHRFFLQEK